MTPPRVLDATIDELLGFIEAATPGPCRALFVADKMPVDCVHFGVVSDTAGYETGRNWKMADAELDAASRNHLRSILLELRERREVDEAVGALLSEIRNHLYIKQDIDRIKDYARSAESLNPHAQKEG